jgi:hypothetical protein
VLWWALDVLRVNVTGRDARFTQVVLELAWNPDAELDPSTAAEVLAGVPRAAQLWAPIGSVVLVAPGAGAHPGVAPAVAVVREQWPAAVVTVVDEAVAALVGAGPGPEPAACVVVHQDAQHTSVAVMAGRAVVAGGLVAGGTRGLAEAVGTHLRTVHRLDAGPEPAWAAVLHDGVFGPAPTVPAIPVHGSVVGGDGPGPRPSGKVTLWPGEARSVVAPAYRPVAELVARVLREAPPQAARLAAVGGLLLTGPHPPGADGRLTDLTGLPARRVVEPEPGFHRPGVLLAGVARLLAEAPPEPVGLPEHTVDLPELLRLAGRLGLPGLPELPELPLPQTLTPAPSRPVAATPEAEAAAPQPVAPMSEAR